MINLIRKILSKEKVIYEKTENRIEKYSGESFKRHLIEIQNTIHKIMDSKDRISSYDSHLCIRHQNVLREIVLKIEDFQNNLITEEEVKEKLLFFQLIPFPIYTKESKFYKELMKMLNDVDSKNSLKLYQLLDVDSLN